jgi:hypothetical protein
MLEAKDTVMTKLDIHTLYARLHKSEGPFPSMNLSTQKDYDLEIAKAQAEISFKAGHDQAKGEFELYFNPDYLDFQKGVEEGRQAGRREVVEWMQEIMLYFSIINDQVLWKAKLKEWEVK